MDSKILRLTLCCVVGVLSGLGLGFTYMVSRAIITEWFDKNLGVASGIASTGAGFGQLALAPIIAILIVKLGIMFAFAIVGGLSGASVLFGCMLSTPQTENIQENEDAHNNNQKENEDQCSKKEKEKSVELVGFSYKNENSEKLEEDKNCDIEFVRSNGNFKVVQMLKNPCLDIFLFHCFLFALSSFSVFAYTLV